MAACGPASPRLCEFSSSALLLLASFRPRSLRGRYRLCCWRPALRPGSASRPWRLNLFLRDRFLIGTEHSRHVATINLRVDLDLGDLGNILGQSIEQSLSELHVSHLSASEHDRDLDLRSLTEETDHMALLGLVIVAVDLRTHLDLLHDHEGLSLACLLLL